MTWALLSIPRFIATLRACPTGLHTRWHISTKRGERHECLDCGYRLREPGPENGRVIL